MEVLLRAIATQGVVVAASSAPVKGASASGSKNVQVRVNPVPFLRPASALAASILAAPATLAVNYDDFVKKAVGRGPSVSESAFPELPSFELPFVELPSVDFDGAGEFLSANQLALVLGLAAVAVPFIASRAFAGPGASFGYVSAVDAYEKLSNPEVNAQLLDVRAVEDIKSEGSPNLKSIKKTAVRVTYAADDDSFVDKVFAKCKDSENSTLYILDRFDGSSASVAKLLANSGFKSVYAIKGGAEGPNGWQSFTDILRFTAAGKGPAMGDAPKSFSLNIDSLKSIIGDGQGVGGDALSTTLGVAAAAGVGLVVLSEAETTLQLLGTVALAQLFLKKFLFAEDRKKTVKEIQNFLETKIAPKEFVEELMGVGRAILPREGEVKAAVESGATVLENELGVDSVTPEALAEKAKEKLGVEIPDVKSRVKEAASDLESNAKAVGSGLESGAGEVKSAVESVTREVTKSTKVSASPAPVEEEKHSSLPVLQGPPSLSPKAVETPVAGDPEPSTTTPDVKEVTPFFESSKDVKPASPFEAVAARASSSSSANSSSLTLSESR